MRKSALSMVIATFLMGSTVSSVSAATPASGKSCTKVGQSSVVNSVKFTCVKSGTKLTWNQGTSSGSTVGTFSAMQKISLSSFANLAQLALTNTENALPSINPPSTVKTSTVSKNSLANFLAASTPHKFSFFGPTPLSETGSNRTGALSLVTSDHRAVYRSQNAIPPWAVGFKLTTTDPQGRFIVATSATGDPGQPYAWRLAYKEQAGIWKYQSISGVSHPDNGQNNFDEVSLGAAGTYSIRLEFVAMTTFYGLGLSDSPGSVTPLLASPQVRVAILGDSWVTPSFSEAGPVHDWDGYPGALTWLSGWNVISAGVRGQGYLQSAGNETYKDRVVRDLVPQNPSVIIFTGSSNDHLFPDQQIADEMGRDIQALQKADPDVLIIVCSPYENGGDQKAPGQSKAMQAQAKSLGVPYIDFINLPLFDQSNNGQRQLSNGHPTRLGSSHIAKQLLTAIAALK